MNPLARFRSILAEGGIDLATARTVLQKQGFEYSDAAIERWLEGKVIPGMSVRFHLVSAAEPAPDDSKWVAQVFVGRPPQSVRQPVRDLCHAARHNKIERVHECLERGVVIDGWDDHGECALGWAAREGHAEIASALLAAGADPMAMSQSPDNAFIAALRSGNRRIIAEFLRYRASADATSSDNRTALEIVAGIPNDDPENVQMIWDHGHYGEGMLKMPLLGAVEAANPRVVERLLKLGADPDATDLERVTALMKASAGGHEAIARSLLNAGASLAIVDNQGNNALHHAAPGQNPALIRALIQAGCDAALQNRAGRRPAELLERAPGEVAEMLENPKLGGPRWFDPDGRPILFYYSKAFGLGFDPRQIDAPILFGGDYQGIMPTRPAYLLREHGRKELRKYSLEWIIPYLERLARREDFSLEDLTRSATSNGREPFTRSQIR